MMSSEARHVGGNIAKKENVQSSLSQNFYVLFCIIVFDLQEHK